jgi:hypothetical protein
MKINIRRLRKFEGNVERINDNRIAYVPNVIMYGYPTIIENRRENEPNGNDNNDN